MIYNLNLPGILLSILIGVYSRLKPGGTDKVQSEIWSAYEVGFIGPWWKGLGD